MRAVEQHPHELGLPPRQTKRTYHVVLRQFVQRHLQEGRIRIAIRGGRSLTPRSVPALVPVAAARAVARVVVFATIDEYDVVVVVVVIVATQLSNVTREVLRMLDQKIVV